MLHGEKDTLLGVQRSFAVLAMLFLRDVAAAVRVSISW